MICADTDPDWLRSSAQLTVRDGSSQAQNSRRRPGLTLPAQADKAIGTPGSTAQPTNNQTSSDWDLKLTSRPTEDARKIDAGQSIVELGDACSRGRVTEGALPASLHQFANRNGIKLRSANPTLVTAHSALKARLTSTADTAWHRKVIRSHKRRWRLSDRFIAGFRLNQVCTDLHAGKDQRRKLASNARRHPSGLDLA